MSLLGLARRFFDRSPGIIPIVSQPTAPPAPPLPKPVEFKDLEEKIRHELTVRGAMRSCPRCGQSSFFIAQNFQMMPVQSAIGGPLVLGGNSIPTAIVVCNNCGYLSQHAIGALGLLPKEFVK